MDKKKEWIAAINYGKYFAFVLSTIFVILFQFKGDMILLKLTLVSYVTAFGLVFTSLVIHACEVYSASRAIKAENANIVTPNEFDKGVVEVQQGELKGEKAEVVSLKSEKVWTVIGAVASGLFMLFTFVVLILC